MGAQVTALALRGKRRKTRTRLCGTAWPSAGRLGRARPTDRS